MASAAFCDSAKTTLSGELANENRFVVALEGEYAMSKYKGHGQLLQSGWVVIWYCMVLAVSEKTLCFYPLIGFKSRFIQVGVKQMSVSLRRLKQKTESDKQLTGGSKSPLAVSR